MFSMVVAGAGMLGSSAALQEAVDRILDSGGGVLSISGTIELEAPLVIRHRDGDPQLTIRAQDGESAVLSGGRKITDWTESVLGGRRVWSAPINDVEFTALWVDGQRRQRARHPNSGYLMTPGSPERTDSLWTGNRSFSYPRNSVKPVFHADGVEAIVMTRWIASRVPVARIDTTHSLIHTLQPTELTIDRGDIFYLENAPEFLDSPGEWWIDKARKLLHYIPLPTEECGSTVAVYPRLKTLLRIEGAPDTGTFVRNVRFEGIEFTHTDWESPRGQKLGQAAVTVSAAIEVRGAIDCSFDRCTIRNVGGSAIKLAAGTKNVVISRCHIDDFGASGILIGPHLAPTLDSLESRSNVVENCLITNGGRTVHGGVGVWIGHSSDNRVSNNRIANLFYTGISVGWKWGPGFSHAHSNTIRQNHVHDIGHPSFDVGPILSDLAGIYTLGEQPGTRIEGNRIAKVAARKYAGAGIYLDEGSATIEVIRNHVVGSSHHSLLINGGRSNLVSENHFLFAGAAQIDIGPGRGIQIMRFERNLVAWDTGDAYYTFRTWQSFSAKDNLYWRLRFARNIRFFTFGLRAWNMLGSEQGAQVADPIFAPTDGWSYGLDAKSPAHAKGIPDFDPSVAGPLLD